MPGFIAPVAAVLEGAQILGGARGSAGAAPLPWLWVPVALGSGAACTLLAPSGFGFGVVGGLFPVSERRNFWLQFLFAAFASSGSCSFAKLAAGGGDFLRRGCKSDPVILPLQPLGDKSQDIGDCKEGAKLYL